jgi:ribosomal-protein-alanine N-acetyltransferase
VGTTPAIKIDRMAREDLDQVIAIEQASFTMPWSRNLFLAEFRNRPVSLMFVALADRPVREVVGYVVCWVFVDEVHLLDLAVRNDVRRQGVGRQIVVAALRAAYEWGARRAFLEVRESNEIALRLYERLGFERSQVRLEYYEHPVESAVVMTLETVIFRRLIALDEGP